MDFGGSEDYQRSYCGHVLWLPSSFPNWNFTKHADSLSTLHEKLQGDSQEDLQFVFEPFPLLTRAPTYSGTSSVWALYSALNFHQHAALPCMM